MKYRRLGRTGLDVSVICLGTMTWGQQNTEAEGHAQMDYALDQGVNFFDTAELYSIPPRPETQGSTERIIGSWFKARRNRDRIVLASKVVGRSANTWFRDDGSPAELSRAQIEEAVDKSLRRLRHRLHRPLPAPLAGPADDLGREPHDLPPRGRLVASDRGDARNPRRPRPGGEDPACGPLQRERLGHHDVPAGTPRPGACPGCRPSRTPTASSTAPTR